MHFHVRACYCFAAIATKQNRDSYQGNGESQSTSMLIFPFALCKLYFILIKRNFLGYTEKYFHM